MGAPDDLDHATDIASEIGKFRTQELVRLVRSIAKIRATLTPAQRQILANTKF